MGSTPNSGEFQDGIVEIKPVVIYGANGKPISSTNPLDVNVDVNVSSPSDTFGTSNNITVATTFSGVPTVSQLAANSSVSLANPGAQATFIAAINIASAFVGTLSFYGLEPDGTTLQIINAHQRNSTVLANNTAISTASALNQTWMGSIADFKSIYVVCTAFTSGSAAVQLGLSAAPYGVAVLNTINAATVTGASIALSSPPSTTNAGSDTALTFASKANHFLIQNNTSANVYVALDATASTSSTTLVPGATWRDDIPVTVIHVYTAAAQNVNGATGIVVLGWL